MKQVLEQLALFLMEKPNRKSENVCLTMAELIVELQAGSEKYVL